MSLEVRVHGSPSRCPYCKDVLDDVREIVACARCGARHHAECRASHGRCVVCSSLELLVYQKTDDPLATRLEVHREGERVEYRWPLIAKDGLVLVPKLGFLRLEPDVIAFVAMEGRRFYEVRAERARVGEATHVSSKLLIDVDDEEHQVATESIGYALAASEVAVLALGIEAWRHRRGR